MIYGVGLLTLLWFEASLGSVFLSFVFACFLASEVSLVEWLGLTLVASLFLSTWFLVPWVLVLLLFWLVPLFYLLKTSYFKRVCLLFAVLAWLGLVLMLHQPLMPSQLVWLGIGFLAVLIFKKDRR